MQTGKKIFCGRIAALTFLFEPIQMIEFKLEGSDTLFKADNRYLMTINCGDLVYAICRSPDTKTAIVEEMLHCRSGKEIPESDKHDFLLRFNATDLPFASTGGDHACDRIRRSCLKDAQDEYLKAKLAGSIHPVILLCPTDVYRLLRPAGADYRSDFLEAMEEETGNKGVNLVVEEHSHLYEGLRIFCPGAAEVLGENPDLGRPFRIVVMTMEEVKVFSEIEPT